MNVPVFLCCVILCSSHVSSVSIFSLLVSAVFLIFIMLYSRLSSPFSFSLSSDAKGRSEASLLEFYKVNFIYA